MGMRGNRLKIIREYVPVPDTSHDIRAAEDILATLVARAFLADHMEIIEGLRKRDCNNVEADSICNKE